MRAGACGLEDPSNDGGTGKAANSATRAVGREDGAQVALHACNGNGDLAVRQARKDFNTSVLAQASNGLNPSWDWYCLCARTII